MRLTLLLFIGLLIYCPEILGQEQLKKIKKRFVLISNNVYADKYEVSQKEYKAFLNHVKNYIGKSIYRTALHDSTQWRKMNGAFNMEPNVRNYHRHASFNDYPIVNISLEGAKAYCAWLTDQYNLKRKKKYQKVIFRLPSESEWKLAVGADAESGFPWTDCWPVPLIKKGIPFIKSPKCRNCVNKLVWANVSFPNRQFFDGILFTGKVGKLKPNVFGLYDIIGNVSEMMEDGTLKGGDWATYLYHCSVNHEQDYTLPDPRVGFRVFMEIIQE